MENDLTLAFIHNFEYDIDSFLGKIYRLEEEVDDFFLCQASHIQDPFRFRSVRRSLLIAQFLIDEKGGIKKEKIIQLIGELEKMGTILYPGGTNDWDIEKKFLKILPLLLEERFLKLLLRFQLPLCHTKAESLVRETLGLEPGSSITDAHVRICALSALLCPLRQNVGACFATAPAILVHEEQPFLFLTDLYELFTTGKLKRTFGGAEFVVPMSPNSGNGDLKKNIASFSSADRILFSPGLLYALTKCGLISHQLKIEERLQKLNFFAAPYLEGSLSIEDLLKKMIPNETIYKKASSYFKSFAENLVLKMWEFTLASFVDVKTEFSRWSLYLSLGLNPEEKGGIGEIIYLHLTAQLKEKNEKIHTFQHEYEVAYDHLAAIERLLKNAGSEAEARRLTAERYSRYYHMQVCLELRDKNQQDAENYASFFSFLMRAYTEKFPDYFQEIYDAELEGVVCEDFYDDSPAGFRLVAKHGRSDPSVWTFIHNEEEYVKALVEFFIAAELQIKFETDWELGKQEIGTITTQIVQYLHSPEFANRAVIQKKPWAYISGGTMDTLLKTYYKREGNFSAESKWVESPFELLIFMIDTLKNTSFGDKPDQRVLITSPTHAFSLLPGQPLFEQAIEERGFTYTWVRDNLVLPGQEFYDRIWLTQAEQTFIFQKFFERIPLRFHKTIAPFQTKIPVKEFRNLLLQELGDSLIFATELDSVLYEMLPLEGIKGAIEIRNKEIADLITNKRSVFEKEDVYLSLMQKASPPLMIVADTNWSERESYFAFLVNPGTDELELWRVDRTGHLGKPMHHWKHFLDGSTRQVWTIYYRPKEYTVSS